MATADDGDALGMRDVRLVVIGDAFAAGVGDPKALGWVGRVVARSQSPDLSPHGVQPGHPRRLLGRRPGPLARGERPPVRARRRAPPGPEHGVRRCRPKACRPPGAGSTWPTSWTTPRRSACPPWWSGRRRPWTRRSTNGCTVVADAQADVCARRHVPFVDCFEPLLKHEQWASDLATGDGVHPGQAGYGLIAWLVLHQGWPDWLGITLG